MQLFKFIVANYKVYLVLLVVIIFNFSIRAQTQGTLLFSTQLTAHNGGYGTSHVVAVWIEDASGNFIKTSLRLANTSHTINSHLPLWKSSSNLNTVDAETGATLTSYSSPISILWNGTDISGETVPDDTYIVWIEESWDEGSSGTSSLSVSFVKGTEPQNVNPTNTENFTNITLSWTPEIASDIFDFSHEDNPVNIYPNPSPGMVNLDFKGLSNISFIRIMNIKGDVVANYQLEKNITGIKKIDLGKLPEGIYFVLVFSENGNTITTRKLLITHE